MHRRASFLSWDWLRDFGSFLRWSKATARQTSARAVPAGQNATEFIQTPLASSVLPIALCDLLLRHAGETGRDSHAGHQVHPIEVDHFVLGTFVGEAAKRLEDVLDSSEGLRMKLVGNGWGFRDGDPMEEILWRSKEMKMKLVGNGVSGIGVQWRRFSGHREGGNPIDHYTTGFDVPTGLASTEDRWMWLAVKVVG